MEPKEGTELTGLRSVKSWLKEHAPMDYQESSMEKDAQNHIQNHVKDGGNEGKKVVPEGTSADSSISCLARQYQTQLYVRTESANSSTYQ